MGKDEPPDPAPLRHCRDVQHIQMPTDPAREPDTMVPRGRLREHEARSARPRREAVELGCPDHDAASRPDAIAPGGMARVSDAERPDADAAPAEVPGMRGE